MPKGLLLSLLPLLGTLSTPAHAQSLWSRPDAEELLLAIETIGAEGLDPVDYAAAALRRDLASGDAAAWSRRATTEFTHLASDLSNGHLRDRRSVAWHITGSPIDAAQASDLMDRALATHNIRGTLASLAL